MEGNIIYNIRGDKEGVIGEGEAFAFLGFYIENRDIGSYNISFCKAESDYIIFNVKSNIEGFENFKFMYKEYREGISRQFFYKIYGGNESREIGEVERFKYMVRYGAKVEDISYVEFIKKFIEYKREKLKEKEAIWIKETIMKS